MPKPWKTQVKAIDPVGHQTTPGRRPARPFSPPSHSSITPLWFTPHDLYAGIGRTAALSTAAPAALAAVLSSSQAMLEFLIDEGPVPPSLFAVSAEIFHLADAERTALSGRLGAGVTHLVMDGLGYAWSAAAEEVIVPTGRLADFVYLHSSMDVVLAEAKGSIRYTATKASNIARAKLAYAKQVDPYVYLSPTAPVSAPSVVGYVAHGYAVSTSCLPESVVGKSPGKAYLAIVEPVIHASSPPGIGGGANGSTTMRADQGDPQVSSNAAATLMLMSYKASFLAANAPNIVDAISIALEIGAGRDPGRNAHKQQFREVSVAADGGESHFLVGVDPISDELFELEQRTGWLFAMRTGQAEQFLNWLSAILAAGSLRPLQVSTAPSIRMGLNGSYVGFADGLSVLERNASTALPRIRHWDPRSGLS